MALSEYIQKDKNDLFNLWLQNNQNLKQFPGLTSFWCVAKVWYQWASIKKLWWLWLMLPLAFLKAQGLCSLKFQGSWLVNHFWEISPKVLLLPNYPGPLSFPPGFSQGWPLCSSAAPRRSTGLGQVARVWKRGSCWKSMALRKRWTSSRHYSKPKGCLNMTLTFLPMMRSEGYFGNGCVSTYFH